MTALASAQEVAFRCVLLVRLRLFSGSKLHTQIPASIIETFKLGQKILLLCFFLIFTVLQFIDGNMQSHVKSLAILAVPIRLRMYLDTALEPRLFVLFEMVVPTIERVHSIVGF